MKQLLTSLLKSKKTRIIVGIGILIFIGVFFFFSNFSKKQTLQNGEQSQNIPSQGTPAIKILPTGSSENAITQWNTYQSLLYTFDYPPDWKLQKTSVAGDGQVFVIKPGNLEKNEMYPQLMIESLPGDRALLQEKIGFLTAFGLKQSNITFLNTSAIKMAGTLRFKNNVGRTVQETSIIFQKGTMIYTLQYQYESEEANTVLEGYFMEMINSLRFI